MNKERQNEAFPASGDWDRNNTYEATESEQLFQKLRISEEGIVPSLLLLLPFHNESRQLYFKTQFIIYCWNLFQSRNAGWMWLHMSISSAPGRLRKKEGHKLEASLQYKERPCLKRIKKFLKRRKEGRKIGML